MASETRIDCPEIFDVLHELSAPCPDYRIEVQVDGNVVRQGVDYDLGNVTIGLPFSKTLDIRCTGYRKAVVHRIDVKGAFSVDLPDTITIDTFTTAQVELRSSSAQGTAGKDKVTVDVYMAGIDSPYRVTFEYTLVEEPGNFVFIMSGTYPDGAEVGLAPGERNISILNLGSTALIVNGVRLTNFVNFTIDQLVQLPLRLEPEESKSLGNLVTTGEPGVTSELRVYGNNASATLFLQIA